LPLPTDAAGLCYRYEDLDTSDILIWDVAFEWLGLGNSYPWWKGLYKLALVSGRIPFMHFSEVRTFSTLPTFCIKLVAACLLLCRVNRRLQLVACMNCASMKYVSSLPEYFDLACFGVHWDDLINICLHERCSFEVTANGMNNEGCNTIQ
jgi:hypothetical protein